MRATGCPANPNPNPNPSPNPNPDPNPNPNPKPNPNPNPNPNAGRRLPGCVGEGVRFVPFEDVLGVGHSKVTLNYPPPSPDTDP